MVVSDDQIIREKSLSFLFLFSKKKMRGSYFASFLKRSWGSVNFIKFVLLLKDKLGKIKNEI